MTPMGYLTASARGVTVRLHVQPRASKTRLVGQHGEALKIAIQSPPVDGAANEEIRRFFAKLFGRPTRDVEILSGDTGRQKRIEISGVDLESARQILSAAL